MPKSIVEPSLEVTDEIWIVSVVNSSGSLSGMTGGGHAMLVIEGLSREPRDSLYATPFVGQYDILAATTEQETKGSSVVNIKGRYWVRCMEGETSKRPQDRQPYHLCPHKSYAINDPVLVKRMIVDIKEEAALSDRAKRGECEYPSYQKVGSAHFLSDIGAGENCASWCIKYLQMVVPDVAETMSKPKVVAGKGGCVIL